MESIQIDLLHVIGDAPEGPWSVFSVSRGEDTVLMSMIIPRSLWMQMTRHDPFSSEITLMEKIGQVAITKRLAQGQTGQSIIITPEDIPGVWPAAEEPWDVTLRRCPTCQQLVPAGELLEGLANALPPDSRGEIEVRVLCPQCMTSNIFRLAPWGIPL
ncbi:MAG: hypothetical protein OWR62_06370 [Sulfobacillus thermotolerans]|nr:hypothetical protein [Sulfobacillus thermotolerans]